MYAKTTIVGNLGQNPEMKFLPDGTAVTNISVATNRVWYKDEQKQEQTIWYRVAIWGKQAENVNQYLKKGSKVLVEGRMNEPKPYMKDDGTPGCGLEMTANSVVFLSSVEVSDAPAF